jgi:hypothetical protein
MHAASSQIRSEISEGLPKFNPRPVDLNPGSNQNAAALNITTLPMFLVRETRIPSDTKILTYKGRTRILMDKYMGPSDGIDRGVLNRVTISQLWGKIPILGRIPFGMAVEMSVSERALDDAGANNPLRTKPIE